MRKIYKIVDGEQVALKASEVKNFIMKVNNWNADQYQKEYDLFKNKLRILKVFQKLNVKVPLNYFISKRKLKNVMVLTISRL